MPGFAAARRSLALACGALALTAAAPAVAGAATPTFDACTTSWTGAAGDGRWSTAGNWDAGPPTATSHVCISKPGAYTVTLDAALADVTVDQLTVGTPDDSAHQRLVITTGANLKVAATRGARTQPTGEIVLRATDQTPARFSAPDLVNAGLVRSEQQGTVNKGVEMLTALDNQGRLEVTTVTYLRAPSTKTIVNAGSIDIAANRRLFADGGAIVEQRGAITGELAIPYGGLVVKGGTMSPGSSVLLEGSYSSGVTYDVAPSAGTTSSNVVMHRGADVMSVTGDIPHGHTLTLQGALVGAGDTDVTVVEPWTNHGRLVLDEATNNIKIHGGKLVNYGTVDVVPSIDTKLITVEQIDNHRSITLQPTDNEKIASNVLITGGLTNATDGTITVGANQNLGLQASNARQSGTIVNDGYFGFTYLTIDGGKTSGNALVKHGLGRLTYAVPTPDTNPSGSSSDIAVEGGSSVYDGLTGSIPAGHRLTIRATQQSSASFVKQPSAWTNYGTLVLTARDNSPAGAVSGVAGGTLTNIGTLRVEGSIGKRTIDALTNAGTIAVTNGRVLEVAGAYQQTSDGTLEMHVAADDAPAPVTALTAELGGTVVPVRDNGYTPTVCQTAKVITTALPAIAGKFDAVAGTGAPRYVGDADSAAMLVWADVPGPPPAVTAQPGNKRVAVEWGAAQANCAALSGYTVRAHPMAAADDSGDVVKQVAADVLSTEVAGLPNDTEYEITVAAANELGDGAAATGALATPTNVGPSAAFSVDPAAPRVNRDVTLTSKATDADGTLAAQRWDLDGDGDFDDATGAIVRHHFTTGGDHTIGLQVTDDDGAVDTATTTVAVAANVAPTARVSASASSLRVGDRVTFTATATDADGAIATRAWDLDGDGAFDDAGGATATTAFTTPGTRTVRFRATDDDGAAAVASATVTVTKPSTPSPPPPTDNGPTPAQAAAAARAALTGAARSLAGAGTTRLAKGLAAAMPVQRPGLYVVGVYAKVKVGKKPPLTLLASGRVTVTTAGTVQVRVKPTAKGRSTLRRAKKLAVIVRVTYTPAGGAPVTKERKTTLKAVKRR